MKYTTTPTKTLKGRIYVASDKSISHRALIFSAIAKGESKIRNLLLSEDVLRTLTIINQLGIETSHTAENLTSDSELLVKGKGFEGLQKPESVLDCGNSGTTMRLLLGLLAGQPFPATVTGDDSLNKRPMDRVMDPLREMGAEFEVDESSGKRLITTVQPEGTSDFFLKGIFYESPVASAQVKSAVLLASLFAKGPSSVTEPQLSRNHTELMLKSMRGKVEIKELTVSTNNPIRLKALDLNVPGDVSSAAFFIVAALITKDSELFIKNVNLNPTRTGLIDVLKYMGAKITIEKQDRAQGEEIGTVRVVSSKLRNVSIGGNLIPRMIDEIPVLALAASVAEGRMKVSGAKELRVKETDRIAAICKELKKLGVVIDEQEDGFVIQGNPDGLKPEGAVCFESYGDHRMVMMEAIAGLLLDKSAEIDDVSSVNTSFPAFFKVLEKVCVSEQKEEQTETEESSF